MFNDVFSYFTLAHLALHIGLVFQLVQSYFIFWCDIIETQLGL